MHFSAGIAVMLLR